MSKSNYYKERVIQLLLFFAFMLPMGALAQNIQLNGIESSFEYQIKIRYDNSRYYNHTGV